MAPESMGYGACYGMADPDKDHIWNFRALQQHALFAHIVILRYWSAREEWRRGEYPTNAILRAMYRETLAIRHFVMPQYREQDEYQAVLRLVPRDGSESEVITHLKGIYARYSNASGEELRSSAAPEGSG